MKKDIYIIYYISAILITAFPSLRLITNLVIICFNVYVTILNQKNQGIALLSSFILSNEIYCALNVVLVLLLNKKIKLKKQSSEITLLFVLMIVNTYINALIYDAFFNVLFYLIYLILLTVVVLAGENIIDNNAMINTIKNFIIIEFLSVLIIAINYKTVTPGDIFTGTLQSAHWLGNWLMINIMVLIYFYAAVIKCSLRKSVKKNVGYIILGLVTLYLADAKSLVLSLVVGMLLYWIFEFIIKKRNGFIICMCSVYLLLFLVSNILYTDFMHSFICKVSDLFGQYIYSEGWNGKFLYITGTFTNSLKNLHSLIGYGFGQYGSRVANMFAYNVMWRNDNSINNFVASTFPPHYLEQYAQYVRYYDAYFVSQIGWRSAVLSYPFNSLTSLIGEAGIIGVLSFAYIIEKKIKNSKCRFVAFYFLVACLFDIYFDIFPCVAIVIVMLLNTQPMQKAINETSIESFDLNNGSFPLTGYFEVIKMKRL